MRVARHPGAEPLNGLFPAGHETRELQLSASVALQATGALPENVNYAINPDTSGLSFLESVPEVAAKLKEPETPRDFGIGAWRASSPPIREARRRLLPAQRLIPTA